jgi:hypothetical protein
MAILVIIFILPYIFVRSSSLRCRKNLFFYFHGNCAKFVQPIAIFLAYLIQLHVDVTGNITAKLCEVGSKFNIFCTLVTMATTAKQK